MWKDIEKEKTYVQKPVLFWTATVIKEKIDFEPEENYWK